MNEFPLQPDDVEQQPLGQSMLAHHSGGLGPTGRGQLKVTVARDVQQPVPFHPGHGLRDRRPGVTETLGDASSKRHNTFLFELEDRSQVHLGGIDEIAHDPILCPNQGFGTPSE
jgi:hypothetical protein